MINQLIKNSPNTYTLFRTWLLLLYKGSVPHVKKFEGMNDMYLIPVIIKYLEEQQNIPILDAINYYSKLRHISGYNNQIKSMIGYEFMRIELKKETKYEIF